MPNSTLGNSGGFCQIDNENGENRSHREAEAVPVPESMRYRQPSLGGSSVEQLVLNNRLPARQQIPDPNLSLHRSQDTIGNNHSTLPAQPDAYSVLHGPSRVASIREGDQNQPDEDKSTTRAGCKDGTTESTLSKVRRKLSQQENPLSHQKSTSRMSSKLPVDRGIVENSPSHVETCESPIMGAGFGDSIPLTREATTSPDQFASLPQAHIRPLTSRNSHISHASTTMTPAPIPDGGLQRQEPLAPQQTGAFAVLPGIAIQHQPKGALTPHPKRLGSSRRRRLFGNRSSKEFAEGAIPPNVTPGAAALPAPSTIPLNSAIPIPPPNTVSPIATSDDASDSNELNQSKALTAIVITALCVVISIAIVAGVGIKLKQDKQSSSDNDPLFSDLRSRLQELSSDAQAVFESIESPQSLGLEWIYEDIKSNGKENVLDNEFRLEARYALVVLYYALGGSRWSKNYRFLSHDHHECAWNGEGENNQGVQCNSNGHVTKVLLGKKIELMLTVVLF